MSNLDLTGKSFGPNGWHNVSITRQNKTFTGTYRTYKDKGGMAMITVKHGDKIKHNQIGGMTALTLAEMILGEMIDVRAV